MFTKNPPSYFVDVGRPHCGSFLSPNSPRTKIFFVPISLWCTILLIFSRLSGMKSFLFHHSRKGLIKNWNFYIQKAETTKYFEKFTFTDQLQNFVPANICLSKVLCIFFQVIITFWNSARPSRPNFCVYWLQPCLESELCNFCKHVL